MKYGPRYRLDDVETNSVQGRTFKNKMRYREMQNLPSKAVDAVEFKTLVKQSALGFTPKRVFSSADPTVPFTGPNLKPTQPPAVEPDTQK